MSSRMTSRVLSRRRRGASAVELAIVAPILLTLLIGAVEIGQFYNVWQKISNASREGARVASKYSTSGSLEVENSVEGYVLDAFSGVPESTIRSALRTTVRDSSGGRITDLTSVGFGSQLSVEVSLEFGAVNWIQGIAALDDQLVTSTTVMRRE